MINYKSEQFQKDEIMKQSRHLFIYAQNNEYRSKFLKSMASDYPIKPDSNEPMALYLDDFGLPKIEGNNQSINKDQLNIIGSEYFSFLVARKLLLTTKDLRIENLEYRLSRLMKMLNGKNTSIDKTIARMEKTIKFYLDYYTKSLQGSTEGLSISSLEIPFLDLERFVIDFKSAIGNKSYLALILDKKNPMAHISTKAVNTFVGSRINSDISMKVATAPEDWETYIDTRDQLVEDVHDYSTIEVDDSYKNYGLKLIMKSGGKLYED